VNTEDMDARMRDTVNQAYVDYIEKELDIRYGEARKDEGPGLRWLTRAGRSRKYGTTSGYWGACQPAALDHPEYRMKDGKRTIIGRPYQLTLADIEELAELARKRGVRLYISNHSNYNADTLLVILTEVSL
jgi:hypothetical protein